MYITGKPEVYQNELENMSPKIKYLYNTERFPIVTYF